MNSIKYTFSKNEKLKSKKEISRIFNNGFFFHSDIISFAFVKSLDIEQTKHRIGISVPKKLFKLAVTRNKIKRLIREAYRLNKHTLYKNSTNDDIYNIMFIYKSKTVLSYNSIQAEIVKILKKVNM